MEATLTERGFQEARLILALHRVTLQKQESSVPAKGMAGEEVFSRLCSNSLFHAELSECWN